MLAAEGIAHLYIITPHVSLPGERHTCHWDRLSVVRPLSVVCAWHVSQRHTCHWHTVSYMSLIQTQRHLTIVCCMCVACFTVSLSKHWTSCFLLSQWRQHLRWVSVVDWWVVCVDGVWQTNSRQKLLLGSSSVSCLLSVSHDMWVACETSVHIISTASSSSRLVISKVCHVFVCEFTVVALSLYGVCNSCDVNWFTTESYSYSQACHIFSQDLKHLPVRCFGGW